MQEEGCNCGSTNCESENCGGSCSSGSCGTSPKSFQTETHELNSIKRVIGVVSGKGGVGKSLVTSTLAVMMRRKGYKVGILDADITGPSIPKVFGVSKKAQGNELGIFPQKTKNEIEIMSVNLLLDEEESPVIWRGPMIAGVVKQFWTDVIWGDVDYLFLDMPPGTGDVPLTVFQSIPLDGIIIVTSPQELVSLIVKKAYNMAKEMNIPILGIIENMSFLKCPDCGKEIKLFGESKIDTVAESLGLPVLAKLPIDPEFAELCDRGEIEKVSNPYIENAVSYIEKKLKIKGESEMIKLAIATEGNQVSSHFGKCENFTLVEIQNSAVKGRTVINTAGNQHGLLPDFLAAHGVNTVISGGMGDGARQKLIAKNIQIYSGVSGEIDTIIDSYIHGKLESNDTGCSEHGHEHSHHHGHESGGCSCGNH